MEPAELLAANSEVIEIVARVFVRGPGKGMELDDARQVASIAALKVLGDERYEQAEHVGGLIATAAYRELTDEMRSGRPTGIRRSGHRAGHQAPLSLNRPLADNDGEAELLEMLVDGREDEYDAVDEQDRITHAVCKLPERLRFVVYLRFWEQLTMAEIGELCGVTESRVSQLLASACAKLRPLLAA